MNEESKIEIAKASAQLTAELIRDRSGHLNRLSWAKGLSRNPDVTEIFDAIHNHLLDVISKE